MRYAVVGGDMRFAYLASMLRESGREATGFLQEKAGGEEISLKELGRCSAVISNWPMRWPFSEREITEAEIMETIKPGSVLLLCGPKFPAERRWDLQYINLWQDERLLQENAYLTAEAAVAAAQHRLGKSCTDMKCAIVGYGRIGSSLVEILKNLGAQVMVVSRSEEKRRRAEGNGAEAADLTEVKEAIRDRQLIFSTPPAPVLDKEALQSVKKDALLIDLASPPYGIDLEAARELGLRAVREPGLPGRHCPMNAACAIFNALIRWEEAEKNG